MLVFLLFIVAAVWSSVRSARNIAGFINKLPAGGLFGGLSGAITPDAFMGQLAEFALPPGLVAAALNSGEPLFGSRQAAAAALQGVIRTATSVMLARRGGNWLPAQARVAPSLFERLSAQPPLQGGAYLPTAITWQSAGAEVAAIATYKLFRGVPIGQLKVMGETVMTSNGAPIAIEDWIFARADNGPSTCPQCGAPDGLVNGVCRYCKTVAGTSSSANDVGGWVLADLREHPAAAA